mgnify:CR=1 FL=1
MKQDFKLVALFLATVAFIATTVSADGEQLTYSSTNRISCVAEMGGYHFNLKELSLPIDE